MYLNKAYLYIIYFCRYENSNRVLLRKLKSYMKQNSLIDQKSNDSKANCSLDDNTNKLICEDSDTNLEESKDSLNPVDLNVSNCLISENVFNENKIQNKSNEQEYNHDHDISKSTSTLAQSEIELRKVLNLLEISKEKENFFAKEIEVRDYYYI